jgi:hypothetical protein
VVLDPRAVKLYLLSKGSLGEAFCQIRFMRQIGVFKLILVELARRRICDLVLSPFQRLVGDVLLVGSVSQLFLDLLTFVNHVALGYFTPLVFLFH